VVKNLFIIHNYLLTVIFAKFVMIVCLAIQNKATITNAKIPFRKMI